MGKTGPRPPLVSRSTRKAWLFRVQILTARPNQWFGITSAREVTVVWSYLGYVGKWAAVFDHNKSVQAIIGAERATKGFPHYSTLDTNLSATQINLLANLTAWNVYEAERSGAFSQLFDAKTE